MSGAATSEVLSPFRLFGPTDRSAALRWASDGYVAALPDPLAARAPVGKRPAWVGERTTRAGTVRLLCTDRDRLQRFGRALWIGDTRLRAVPPVEWGGVWSLVAYGKPYLRIGTVFWMTPPEQLGWFGVWVTGARPSVFGRPKRDGSWAKVPRFYGPDERRNTQRWMTWQGHGWSAVADPHCKTVPDRSAVPGLILRAMAWHPLSVVSNQPAPESVRAARTSLVRADAIDGRVLAQVPARIVFRTQSEAVAAFGESLWLVSDYADPEAFGGWTPGGADWEWLIGSLKRLRGR